MKIHSAESITAARNARYPGLASSGQLDQIDASSEPGQVDAIDAAAVKSYGAVSGPLRWVKAIDHFYQGGELIQFGDFVQVQEIDAKRLVNNGRAAFASDEEVQAASRKKA